MTITLPGQKSIRLAVVILWGIFGGERATGAEPEPPVARDALVYKDGDRVQGKFVAREGDMIVFKADRFGELRVAAADAVVVMAEKTLDEPKPAVPLLAGETPPAETPAKAAARREEVERLKIWEWFS